MFGLLAIVALGALLGGCGSGDEATTNDGGAAEAARAGSGETSGADKQGESGAGSKGDSKSRGKDEGEGKRGGSPGSHPHAAADEPGSGSARREIVKRKLEKSCPPDADKASCEALVEGFIDGKGKSKGHGVNGPEDCTQAMSKEECEATLKAQKAGEGTYSVDVEECLDNPTPRCEEVLRPFFEQQQAAQQSGS
jgi:hypothetical protein